MRKRRYENDTSEVANASKRRRLTGSSSAFQRRSSRRIPADIDAEETPQHPAMEGQAAESTNEAIGTPIPRRYNFRRRAGAKIPSSPSRQTQDRELHFKRNEAINVPEIIVLSSDSEGNEAANDFEVIVISSDSDQTQREELRVERNEASNVPQETGTEPGGPQRSQGYLTENTIPPETNQESQVLNSLLRSDILASAGIRLSDAVIKPLQPPESIPMVPLGEMSPLALPQQSEITPGSSRDCGNLGKHKITPTTLNLDPSVGTEQALTSAPLTPTKKTGRSKKCEIAETSLAKERTETPITDISSFARWFELLDELYASLNSLQESIRNTKPGGIESELDHMTKTRAEVADNFQFILLSIYLAMIQIFNKLQRGINPLKTYRAEILTLLEAIVKCPLTPISDGCSNKLWDLVREFHNIFLQKSNDLYSKVHNLFKTYIDQFMQRCGFCCGQYYKSIPIIYCKCTFYCPIYPWETFYEHPCEEKVYTLESRCYKDFKSGNSQGISSTQVAAFNLCAECYRGLRSDKKSFKMLENNCEKEEERIKCSRCFKEWHKYCALHVKEFEKNDFICPPCIQRLKISNAPNFYDSAKWPKCELSRFIECKVNTFLKTKKEQCGEVIIRILSDSTSKYELNQLRNLQIHENARNFIYREKGIFAFQKCPDNNYVCFFGFYVQEYGKDSAEPNRDRVYLSYLDSVPFFEPKNLRTSVYHEILCAYMEYVKILDFKAVHLWASPPDETIEYIFNSHPPSQQMPDTARLVRWYQLMVNQAIERGIVLKNYTLQEYVTRFCNMPPNCLPYFKGDHWPSKVEEIMQRLRRSSRASGASLSEDELTNKFWSRLRKEIEVSGETFQVYTLKEDQSSHEISDPDALFPIMAMKDREAFLKWCRQNEYEFNTLRRAKYSTKAIFHMYFQELEKRRRRSRRKSL